MFLLSKILPWFVLPFGVSLILLVWGLARRRRGFVIAGVAVLLVSSNPLVGHALMRATEGWAERRGVEALPTADAIVVLSAGRSMAPGPDRVSEWADANRFFGGMDLMRAQKAPLLIFTGAAISNGPVFPREGNVLADLAKALGVPESRILVTDLVINTADEARLVAEVLRTRQVKSPRVLLVTSAFHMRRARQMFEQQGLTVEPFPVDFRVPEVTRIKLMSFLPSVTALNQTHTALREFYGRAFYRVWGTSP